VVLIIGISIPISTVIASAHPGRTDAKGGHAVKRKAGDTKSVHITIMIKNMKYCSS